MATFTYPIVSIFAADGKLSGPVFIHVRRTAAFRRAYPSKAPTPPQRRAQNAFRYVDLRWQRLSRADRDLWNAYRRWENKFGYNQFQKINIPRRLQGLPLLLVPPTL